MKTIGIIGLGPMGQRYIRAVEMLENVRLAVADLREDAVEQALRQTHVDAVGYSRHTDMLRSESLDVLVIATNGPSHYPIFVDAVNAGVKRVLCEKPIATSLRDARNMLKIARDNVVVLAVNHGRRWSSTYIALRDKLREGLIGPVESVVFSMGGGQMACNGSHFLDLACFLVDQPIKQVIGFLNDEGIPNPRGACFQDPGAYALLHLGNGTRMFFELPDDLGIPPLLIINGKYGRVLVDELKKVCHIETRSTEDRDLPITRYGTPLSVQHRQEVLLDVVELSKVAVQHLLEGRVPAEPEHAVHALEAVIAIHYSHQLGNVPVSLPLTDEIIVNRSFTFT